MLAAGRQMSPIRLGKKTAGAKKSVKAAPRWARGRPRAGPGAAWGGVYGSGAGARCITGRRCPAADVSGTLCVSLPLISRCACSLPEFWCCKGTFQVQGDALLKGSKGPGQARGLRPARVGQGGGRGRRHPRPRHESPGWRPRKCCRRQGQGRAWSDQTESGRGDAVLAFAHRLCVDNT